ncbi:unnamed protein product, partial [Sphacelaria rigidula]
RKLEDVFRPKTNGAETRFVGKCDGVKIGVRDDPEQKLLEMEELARNLNSYEEHERLSENHILLKFLNALPFEYHIQKQLLEDREGSLTREVVLTSTQKRFESTSLKQELARGKKSSPGDQALLAGGGTGKPSGAHRKGKPGKSQGSGQKNGGSQSSSSSGSASSDGKPATGQLLRCHVCDENTTHRARNCPKRYCGRCGQQGHTSSVCSVADGEAFTSLDTTINGNLGEYALSVERGGDSQQGEGEPWIFDTGATQHFSHDSHGMTEYRE